MPLRAGLMYFRKVCSSTSNDAYILDTDTSVVSGTEAAPAATTLPTVTSARETRPATGASMRV